MAWAALILVVSSTPGSDLPPTGLSDKIEHAGAYAILGALCVRSMQASPSMRGILMTTALVSLYGAIDEWHQRFIPGRYPDPLDWVADSAGAAAGVAAAAGFRASRARRPQERA